MKVLLINNCHFLRGGSEAVYFNTAKLLKKHGHEVVFFSINDEKNVTSDEKEYFISKSGAAKKVLTYIYNWDAAKKLDEILTIEKPDIAHSHLMWGGINQSIFHVLKKHRVPLVHTVHDYRMVCPAYTFRNGNGEVCEKCKGGHFIECFKNRCAKGSTFQSALMTTEMLLRNKKWHPALNLNGIIYVSDFAKRKHEEFDTKFEKAKSLVLYNFTTVGEQFPPVERDGGYYLYYGRLSHEKGIASLVEAFSKHPEMMLKVVGTGPKEEELKQKNYCNVEFLGYKTGEELFNLVQNAKFVCVPSEWYENNPMTIVESYSMGVPVIGARIGGIPEIIEEGKTGFLFDSGDVDSLDRVISDVANIDTIDYGKMKKSAYQFFCSHFSSEEYYKTLMLFYNEVIFNYR